MFQVIHVFDEYYYVLFIDNDGSSYVIDDSQILAELITHGKVNLNN